MTATRVTSPTNTAGRFDGYKYAWPRLREERKEQGWTLDVAAAKLPGLSRVFLGEVERQVSAASPDLQRKLAELYGLPVGELFDPESTVSLRRRENEGEWVRQRLACEILGVAKQTLCCRLEPAGVVERRGGSSPFQYHRPTLEELVPPGSLTLPEIAKRNDLTLSQVWRYRRRRLLEAFQPWPKANYRVRPEEAERFARQLRVERGRALQPDEVEEARRLRAEGCSYKEIADAFKVSHPTARAYTKDVDPAKTRPPEVGARISATKSRQTAEWAAEVPRGGCRVPGCPDPHCQREYGECHCEDACGGTTTLAKQSDRSRNLVAGEPQRYLPKHHQPLSGDDARKRVEERRQTIAGRKAAGWLTRAQAAEKLEVSEREIGYYEEVGLEYEAEGGSHFYRPEAIKRFNESWWRGFGNGRRRHWLDNRDGSKAHKAQRSVNHLVKLGVPDDVARARIAARRRTQLSAFNGAEAGRKAGRVAGRKRGYTERQAKAVREQRSQHPEWGRAHLARRNQLTESQVRSILERKLAGD